SSRRWWASASPKRKSTKGSTSPSAVRKPIRSSSANDRLLSHECTGAPRAPLFLGRYVGHGPCEPRLHHFGAAMHHGARTIPSHAANNTEMHPARTHNTLFLLHTRRHLASGTGSAF